MQLIEQDQPDLVVLDLNLPVKDGLEVCREMRRFSQRPVLMLTARDEEADEVSGFDAGADDYLGKPVRPRVLLARIRALLRRSDPIDADGPTRCIVAELSVDLSSRSAVLRGVTLLLSSQEFDVLWLLMRNAGEAVKRQTLVSTVRGIDYDGLDRSVDMIVSRLRRKLGDDPDAPQWIKTVRGKGYLLGTGGGQP